MKFVTIVSCFFIIGMITAVKEIGATDQEDGRAHASEEVGIGGNAIQMPLGRILLVHKDSQYCAVKFTETWKGKTESARFTNYESYYQGDGSGDFSSKGVQFTKDTLVDRQSVLGRLYPVPFGHRNQEIKCGPIRLFWSGIDWVCFFGLKQKQGDYGIELAPTKWTDISQVNVFDPRLKWYRFDEKRKHVRIPIDQLWEDGEEKK
jgi:hypothetical protein